MLRYRELNTLYGISRTNKIMRWTASVVENDDLTATLIIKTGYDDGKIREIPKLISEGKNIGKSNETSPFEQALSEATSQWNKKKDNNYEEFKIDPNNYKPRIMRPMLARNTGEGKIVYPCYMQPKFNGICNLAEFNGNILHHSRGGKLFNSVGHLDKYIKSIDPCAPLHGELYKHGWSLQKIGAYTKKLREDSHLLEYWVYDIAWLGKTFEERLDYLTHKIPGMNNFQPIILAPTVMVHNPDEVKMYHDKWVSEGFEGGMLKNIHGLYMFEYRSDDIEKVKMFKEAEFPIIGGKQGTGLDTGCVIYRCITPESREFDVRPMGTVEERQTMYNNLSQDIGKPLSIRFTEYSEDMIPQQPIGVCIRDYE